MVEPRPDKWMSAADRHCRRAIIRVRSYRIVHARVRYLDGATPYSSRPGGESVQGFRNEQPIADYAGRREIVRLRNDRHGCHANWTPPSETASDRKKKKKKNSTIKAIAREDRVSGNVLSKDPCRSRAKIANNKINDVVDKERRRVFMLFQNHIFSFAIQFNRSQLLQINRRHRI